MLRMITLLLLIKLMLIGALTTAANAADPDRLPAQAGAPELYISVVRPAVASPVPVAVLLHGGAGLNREQMEGFKGWSSWLRDRGVASLIIDSQRGRNVRGAHFDGNMAAYMTLLRERASDARRGLDWLASTGWADSQRLLLFGESQGAGGALVAASDGTLRVPEVLFYPTCGPLQKAVGSAAYPRSLWVLGEYDELAPAKDCIAMREAYIRAGVPAASIEVVTMPRAHHAFDIPMPQPGIVLGKRVEFNATARDQSRLEVERFLRSSGYVR